MERREKLVRISDHLHHEIERMELYYDRLSLDEELGELQCALVDSFTIHARCLSEFLWDPKKYKDSDVRASDFAENTPWRPPARSEFLEQWCEHMTDKRLAHLTYERLDICEEQEKLPIGKIYWEIKEVLGLFYQWVPKQNIGGRLRARIDSAGSPNKTEAQRPINQPATIEKAVGTSSITPAITYEPGSCERGES